MEEEFEHPEELTDEQRKANRERFRKRKEAQGKLGIPFVAGDSEYSYSQRLHKLKGGWIDQRK